MQFSLRWPIRRADLPSSPGTRNNRSGRFHGASSAERGGSPKDKTGDQRQSDTMAPAQWTGCSGRIREPGPSGNWDDPPEG